MKRNSLSKRLPILIFCGYLTIVSSQQRGEGEGKIGCQQKSTSGRSYAGEANTTVKGVPCQRWSDTEPHDHSFTHVGDHNFCRNPDGDSQVWCYTTDPEVQYQYCGVPFCPSLKAIDLSLDNDEELDENNSYTHATLQKDTFPSSFTICTAFMVERWPEYTNSFLFVLTDDEEETWHWIQIYAAETFTEFQFELEDSPRFTVKSASLFYPLQWTRVCLSMDSNTSTVRLVVDGELLLQKVWKVKNKPDNLNLVLGSGISGTSEYPGQTTSLNIFSSALPLEQMKLQTSAGKEECGLEGDFLGWEKSLKEEEWTLGSKARFVDLDGGLESPCMAKAKVNVFPTNQFHYHTDCMDHCQKLGGRSPPVRTEMEWENLLKEIKAVSPDPERLPEKIWLSATEGDIELELRILDHWPEGTRAEEGVWRDYYTGEKLENYRKPWILDFGIGDRDLGDNYNCIEFYTTSAEVRSWTEWECRGKNGCPCQYETPPLVNLRGFCPGTLVEHVRYTTTQSAIDPSNIIIVGYNGARIEYDSLLSQWILSDPRLNVTARTRASHISYALGKHNWTISGDGYQCSEGKDYTLEMKLTGCNKTQFTCDNGQCVKMEERCNQLPDCKDTSDEMDCKMLVLKKGYNKRVPPVGATGREVKTLEPVPVNVSLTLFKVVAIEEEDHSIELQFQISLEWKENRATYYNLKPKSYLNALSMDEINTLWLPLVIYTNTDQQETTRLGCCVEWSTSVNVNREGNFTRSGYEVLDETELFKGGENSLIMTQSYTHEFQCVFQLERYPFDTQVRI